MNHLPAVTVSEMQSHRAPLALDRSVRSIDTDGHLRISDVILSEACVSPYAGSEIPDYRGLGLQPDHIYQLLRPAAELAKATRSFRGKPLMSVHRPISSADHPHSIVVGAVGNDTSFDGRYLRGSLSVWDDSAIAGIETGAQRGISCGYRYRVNMTPGVHDGTPYQGVMTDLEANHVALVAEPRVASAMVGDAAMKRRIAMDDDPFRPLNDFHREKLQTPEDIATADELVQQLADALTSTGQADDLRPRRGVPGAAGAMDARLRQRVAEGRIRTMAATTTALERKFPGATKLRRSW